MPFHVTLMGICVGGQAVVEISFAACSTLKFDRLRGEQHQLLIIDVAERIIFQLNKALSFNSYGRKLSPKCPGHFAPPRRSGFSAPTTLLGQDLAPRTSQMPIFPEHMDAKDFSGVPSSAMVCQEPRSNPRLGDREEESWVALQFWAACLGRHSAANEESDVMCRAG